MLSRELDLLNKIRPNWFEIWHDEQEIPYLLILCGTMDSEFFIIDIKDNSVVFQSKNYNEAKFWLLEDEFELVTGRFFSSDL